MLNVKILYVVRALSLTLSVFGLLVWLYVVAIQITHPNYLHTTLTHIEVFPLNLRVDLTGISAFVVSGFSFFVWQLTRHEK